MKTSHSFPISLTAVSLLAACSGGSQTATVPSAQSSAISVRADVRFGLSRAQLERAIADRGPGDARAAKTTPTLFVSDIQTQSIDLFPANAKNPTQSGTITDGINAPVNDAVDAAGTLYVANNGNSTVTEYPLGSSSPSVTLSNQIVYPNGITVDDRGNVYVTSGANVGSCYVLMFPKGASAPSEQIGTFYLPVGLTTDRKGDLFVADTFSNVVWEVPKGSKTPKNLKLSGLNDPTGVAIDPQNHLWVVNDASNTALGYVIGKKMPYATISTNLTGPYSVAFGSTGRLFIGNNNNYPGDVTVFKKNAKAPYATFTVDNPSGLAVYPAPK